MSGRRGRERAVAESGRRPRAGGDQADIVSGQKPRPRSADTEKPYRVSDKADDVSIK